jgi:hypothetical protein
MNKMLALVGFFLAVVMLSVVLVVLPNQEVDARISVKQKGSNRCNRNAFCRNTGTITIHSSTSSPPTLPGSALSPPLPDLGCPDGPFCTTVPPDNGIALP